MTKPKTVKQLLTEANELARERGMGIGIEPSATLKGTWHSWAGDPQGIGIEISYAKTKALAYRCLIAALREVPVVNQSDTIPFPGRVCTCSVRADRGEALPKRQSHFDDCAVFGREVPVRKGKR